MDNKKLYLILILSLLVLPMVASAPPFAVGDFAEGYQLRLGSTEFIKTNISFDFHVHVFNITNGVPIIEGIACYFHVYNQSGNHIFKGEDITSSNFDYEITIPAQNFSSIGEYPVVVQCNSSTLGGFTSTELIVKETTEQFTTAKSFFYLGLLSILVFLFIFTISMIPKLPSGNTTDDYGTLLSINNLKYLRPILFVIAWSLLLAIVFSASGLATAYLETTLFADLFFNIYRVMFLLTLPMAIISFIYIIVQIFRDMKFKEMIERGVDIEATP